MGGVTAKGAKRIAADIANNFNGRGEGVAGTLISIFPGTPEVVAGFIYVAKFENNTVTAVKKAKILIVKFNGIAPVVTFWYLESIGCAIRHLVVKSGGIAWIEWLAVGAYKIADIIAKTGRVGKQAV